jgi:hypothetical protein
MTSYIDMQKLKKRGKTIPNPDREKPRPGASSPCTARHTCTRPTARRDRHRLHHRGRERNRRRRSQHRAHARESRGRGRGHRRRAPALERRGGDNPRRAQQIFEDSSTDASRLRVRATCRGLHLIRFGMKASSRKTGELGRTAEKGSMDYVASESRPLLGVLPSNARAFAYAGIAAG